MTRFERRETPTNGVGISIADCRTVDEAIYKGGLDWNLIQQPVYVGGVELPKYRATVREDTGKVLGITKDKYRPIQNNEVFSFADNLLELGATFDKIGCYKGGEKVWMSLKLPSRDIMGEQFDLYAFLINGNNGKSSLHDVLTTVRASCCNMWKGVVRNAKFIDSIGHNRSADWKIELAKQLMAESVKYYEGMENTFEELDKIRLDKNAVKDLIAKLMPIPEGDNVSERTKNTARERQDELIYVFENAPDLIDMPDTGRKFINAISDFDSHCEPKRHTKGFAENRLMKLVDSTTLTDKAYKMVMEMA